MKEVAPGVGCLTTGIVNTFFVGQPEQPWTLVDTGMPGNTKKLLAAAEARYGANNPPAAIILTHGHFDHTGNVRQLADLWNVPIYAHPLEMPYLTGRSKYPPFDPTVGGFFPALSRFFPESGVNLGTRLQELPPDGLLPMMSGWKWHFTPGHAPGHVSLFRASDRVLIAGDAFITMNMDSFRDTITQKPELVRPPTYATYDWESAQRSISLLAGLRPSIAATGHGLPLSGDHFADQLQEFTAHFPRPAHGRYVNAPAHTDAGGIVTVPPPVPDPVPKVAAAIAAAALSTFWLSRKLRRSEH